MPPTALLQEVVLAFALGALVGLERERAAEEKYAGLRTLSIFTAAGPVAVIVADRAASIAPVAIYLLLGAAFSILVLALRLRMGQQEVGLTTSSTVFLMALVGVLVGYDRYFIAVAVTLITVFLLAEKKSLHRYADRFSADDISDAVGLGILALVLYPVVPAGPVGPYGVLYLREALLFVIFILLVQFAAFAGLKMLESRLGFLLSAALGGAVSSLAVVSTVAGLVREQRLGRSAVAAATAAVTA
ncbi:MAG: MgtC/SapB family protein, partial [Candidatus Nanohaloarchaea archaeon]